MRAPSSIAAAFSRIPGPVAGALWMVASCAGFAAMTVIVRLVAAEIHPIEIGFFRNLFGLLFLAPWLARAGLANFRTRRLAMHGLRAVSGTVSMVFWFIGIVLMPLAEATALSFTAPLFATAGAGLFLGETVGWRRAAATIVGFAGALVVLRPDLAALTLPAMLVLGSSAFTAVSMLSVKSLSRTDSATTIVLYMGLLTTPLSAVLAAFVWTTPSLWALVWMMGLGLVATLANLAFVRAFAAADASAVLPFDFSRLPFTALLGYAYFGERPDGWTWIGAAIIFGATLYTAHREAVLAGRRRRRPAALAPRPEDPGAPKPG